MQFILWQQSNMNHAKINNYTKCMWSQHNNIKSTTCLVFAICFVQLFRWSFSQLLNDSLDQSVHVNCSHLSRFNHLLVAGRSLLRVVLQDNNIGDQGYTCSCVYVHVVVQILSHMMIAQLRNTVLKNIILFVIESFYCGHHVHNSSQQCPDCRLCILFRLKTW